MEDIEDLRPNEPVDRGDTSRLATTPLSAASRPSQADEGVRSSLSYLLLFAGALVVPVLILAAILAGFYVMNDQQRAQSMALSSARELETGVEAELGSPHLMLRALATSPYLAEGNIERFRLQVLDLSEATETAILLKRAGEARWAMEASQPDALRVSPVEILAVEGRLTASERSMVGGLSVTPDGVPYVLITMPVFRNGVLAYVLATPIHARQLERIAQRMVGDENQIAVVLDSGNILVARSQHHDVLVGSPASEQWTAETVAAEGVWYGRNLDGAQVMTAYVRSEDTGWTFAISVPQALFDGPLWRAIGAVAATGAMLLALAGLIAFRIGSRLSGAIGTLAFAGEAVARGEAVGPVRTKVTEVNAVGRTLSWAAEQARERTVHLQSILQTVPSAMIVIDGQGLIRSFSRSAERMFGYGLDQVIGQNVSMLMPEPDRSGHDGYLLRYRNTGERRIIGKGRLVTGRRSDGTKFPIELHVGEARIGGEVVFTGFLRDRSEEHHMEQELRQTQKMEAIGKLTGGVAHDFNNLLTVINGNLEMLESRIAPEDRDLLIDAREAADLAAQLTSSLLAFGRRMPLAPILTDIGTLVSGTGDLLRRTLGETISIRTSVETDRYSVVDAHQLQNAILNLAINSRDAMPEGGRLFIEVSESELDADYAQAHTEVAPGSYVMIAVTDTGSGMTEEVRDRAFEPFFTTKPTGSGTGLGLSSVYGFVKQSGGHVALYSEPDRGTTIRIYLPSVAKNGRQPERPLLTAADLPLSRGETILLVEDDERVRRITATRLESLGYTVVEAANGPDAIKLLESGKPIDLVFTDMIMPGGMTGADLADLVKERWPRIPLLFTSGYANQEDLEQADAASRNWLRKPYSLAELARKLRTILE